MLSWLLRLTGLLLIGLLLFACGNTPQNTEEDDSPDDSTKVSNDAKPVGTEWQLVWADEFDSESIDEKNWNLQVLDAGQYNDEWQRYTDSPENAYIEDGNLVIKAIHESEEHGMDQYTSARLNTAEKQAWKYGKIATRAKLPYGQGIWPAFWMLGANIDQNGGDTPWPQCGEVDIFELFGYKSDSVVVGYLHYADSSDSHAFTHGGSYKLNDGIFADDFHVFELIWNEEQITWLVDGEEFGSLPITGEELTEFHQEFFLLLNLAVGGTFAGRPDASNVFPQYMYVDWVRVYKHVES